MATSRRALHYVYKIGDRTETMKFYREILGMKVLRHEEFTEGCDAACNGPYDGKWSKTMIGYGAEEDHFVCELTYNYGISSYKQGNSRTGFFIDSPEIIERAKAAGVPVKEEGGAYALEAPGGYKFFINNKSFSSKDPVCKMSLSSSNIAATTKYWRDLLGMKLLPGSNDKTIRLSYGDGQAMLEFTQIDGAVDHAKAGGRIAFACPSSQLKSIEATVKDAGHTILTPYISLDTPGKATVQVVILADPDGHEICFVGEEGFGELSKVDPNSDALLTEAIQKDKSDDWFAQRGGKQTEQ